MGHKKHRHHQLQQATQTAAAPTKSIEERWLERKEPQHLIWGKEQWAWLAVSVVCAIILGCQGMYLVTHWDDWGRSVYPGGNDISIIDGQVQAITVAGDGSESGNSLPKNTCYVNFGDQGSLLLEPEWADYFQIGSRYDLGVTNRHGEKIDKIWSYRLRRET